MSIHRLLRTALVAVVALSLTACASLPTSGDVRPGLSSTDHDADTDVTYVPNGPSVGASSEQIVRGFIDAASSPADNWAIARQFLAAEFADNWKPHAGVTIDTSISDRRFEAADPEDAGDTQTIQLSMKQSGSVDEAGVYSAVAGPARGAELTFQLKKNEQGEWRITVAPDGVVLDAPAFAAADVFRPYALQFFDPTWSYLVPDVRWFPKRKSTASRVVQSLVDGGPSPWLAESVRTAFAGDIELARDTVPVEGQIAEVELTAAAQGADAATLGRLRTQLERSLIGAGVTGVRLMSGGRELVAPAVPVAPATVDSRPLVLTDEGFGYLVGGEVENLPRVAEEILTFPQPIRAIVAGPDGAPFTVVQSEAGAVYSIGDGQINELDSRPGLITPSLDRFGYTWTVPATVPSGVLAWTSEVAERPVAGFADASAISQLVVSREGTRVAAVVTVGSQQQVEVAGVVRDERGLPTRLGEPISLGWLTGPVLGLAWLDSETIGVLTKDGDDTLLLQMPIGGPSVTMDVPDDAVALAPSTPASSVRLLGADGVLWSRSGPTWQSERANVRVLATQISGS